MGKFRLPVSVFKSLGSECVVAEEVWSGCAGARPEYNLPNGFTLLAPAGQPLSPVLDEPPLGSVLRVSYTNDDRASVFVAYRDGCVYGSVDGLLTWHCTDGESRSWAQIETLPAMLIEKLYPQR